MTIYDESKHPRGQAGNAGQFRDKDNSAPETVLHARDLRLSAPQQDLLRNAQKMGTDSYGLLVSSNRYRTALSLERMGLGTVRYQGPGGRGWFTSLPAGTDRNE